MTEPTAFGYRATAVNQGEQMGGQWRGIFVRLRAIRWHDWLNHVYVLVATVATYVAYVRGSTTDRELVFGISLSVYFAVLLLVVFASVFMWGKKARYAEATKPIHNAIHASRDAYRYLVWCLDPHKKAFNYDSRYLEEALVRCMTATASAFSLTTSVSCRACIKRLGWDKTLSGVFVQTLARDSDSRERCRERDQPHLDRHLVRDNTDFRRVFERKTHCFISGDLSKLEHYENTSLGSDGRRLTHGGKWPLEYRSTIVVPIRYVFSRHDIENLGAEVGENQNLYGFLCVDSGARHAFDKRYDVEMAHAIADALVPTLEALGRVRDQQKPVRTESGDTTK